jgi:hypothetical protein
MKLSEPLVKRVAFGDLASVQAVTRVNAEQAPKRVMQEPTRRYRGKAEANGETRAIELQWTCRGNGDGMQATGNSETREAPPVAAIEPTGIS